MIETLFAFLGGNAFRLLFGELSSAWTKWQDHRHELAMLQIQAEADAARHAQNLEAIRVQAELGVQTIRVQGEADVSRTEGDAWLDAVRATSRATGVAWVDAWNGAIRPALATMCMLLIVGDWVQSGWDLDSYSWTLISAVIGIYIADRSLLARGK
jgi:hypothetical protein